MAIPRTRFEFVAVPSLALFEVALFGHEIGERATVASGWAEYESAPIVAFFGGATLRLRRRPTGEITGNLGVSG